MGIAVLGPVRLVDGDRTAPIRSSLRRTLLARLLVSSNRSVPAGELVEAMWGVDGWDRGHQRLWFHVSKLRTLLDGLAVVERSPSGYALRIDTRQVDAVRFQTLIEGARDLSESDHDRATALVEEAGRLWEGTPYEDVIECPAVEVERRRLILLHLDAVELGFDLALRSGRGAAVVADIEATILAHPFHDRYRSQLMHALWQAGRTSEARLVYEAACRFSDEEFGGVVAAHLDEAMTAIDGGEEPRPASSTRSSEPPVARSWRQRRTGAEPPAFRTSFIGRDRLVEQVVTSVQHGGVVSLVGPAGVGKTRLAVEAAGSTAVRTAVERCYFVDLAELDMGSHVTHAVAQAVHPDASSLSSPVDTIAAALGRGDALVILDNCEHVITAVADLVDVLSHACPTVRWLTTGRERLRLSGETVVEVAPLDEWTAVRLLRQRAGIADGVSSPEATDVHRQICRRLDHLPLAIELAAERLSSLPAEELLIGLDDRFGLLTAGDRGGPARQQTLRAALEWSVERLDADDRTVFQRIGVFSGPFSVADAAAVCRDTVNTARTRTGLANLVERNLIQRRGPNPPFRLLETMRHYGLEELDRSGRREELLQRHAEHFAAKAVEHRVDAFGPRENEVVDAVVAQSGNHLQALTTLIEGRRWGPLAEYAEALADTVFWLRGVWIEPFRRLAELAENVPDPAPKKWSSILAIASNVAWARGHVDQGERLHRLGVDVNPDDPHVWIQGSYVAGRLGDGRLAAERAHRAVAVAAADHPWQRLPALNALSAGLARTPRQDVPDIDVGKLLLDEAARLQSTTARCYGEAAVAARVAPGTPTAALHCRRAAVLADRGRSPMMRIFARRLQIAHLSCADLDQARVVLISMLRDPQWNGEVFLPTIALHAAAGFFAEAGRMSLAVELASGLPNRMSNPARSTAVAKLTAMAEPNVGDEPSFEEMKKRLDRVLIEAEAGV